MNKDLISIIIPVYNSEKYIRRCLDSVIGQTYKNIEIIIIDDGSTDSSGNICDEYGKMYNQINVVHQENHGVSYARNIGIKHATGKFIVFSDSDDYLENIMVELLYENIITTDSDLSICNYYNVIEDNMMKANVIETNRDIDKRKFFDNFDKYDGVLWNKLFKKEIIDKNEIMFDESMTVCEDMLFVAKYALCCDNSFSYIDVPLYYYNKNENSVINTMDRVKKRQQLEANIEFIDIYKQKTNSQKYFYYETMFIFMAVDYMIANGNEKNLQDKIAEYVSDGCISKEKNVKTKIKLLLYVYFPRLIRFIKLIRRKKVTS